MELKIKNKLTIDKEQLKTLANSEIELRYWIKDLSIINNSILFESDFGYDKKYLTSFKDNSFKFIDLNPFENKHKYRIVKTQDKNGIDLWEDPDYPRGLVDYSSTNYISFTHQSKFGLLNLFNLYIWNDFDSEPIEITIPKQLKTKKGTDSTGKDFYRDLNIIKVGHSTIENQIPVIFSDYQTSQRPQYFSVLEFDIVSKTAHWKFIENEMPINLDLEEYPHEKFIEEYGYKPFVSDIFWDGENFKTFTWGCTTNIAKHGYDCKVLLSANTRGKRNKVLLQPEKIAMAKFPVNQDYVIMQPYFKKDGKPYIYYIKTNESIFPNPPRGYSKFELFEVTKNSIWLMFEENEKIEIIECELN